MTARSTEIQTSRQAGGTAGEATGHERLEAEDKTDQTTAKLKKAPDDVKHAFTE